MPHIHNQYDFVVSVFIVDRGKVLLIHHKRYDKWLPIGGHIELSEDPEQALFREIREECGLKVKVLSHKPPIKHPGVKPILVPSYVDVHRIQRGHRHVAFVYFAISRTTRVSLHEKEHRAFRWLSRGDLNRRGYDLSKSIRFYCLEALKAAST